MLVFFILSRKGGKNTQSQLLKIENKATIKIEIAATPAGRAKGYSNRPQISYSEGMLFVFPIAVNYPFWMKDMLFDLDFIFIKNNSIVYLIKKVPSPKNNKGKIAIVNSPKKFDKVLEVKSGFVDKYKIKIGDKVNY